MNIVAAIMYIDSDGTFMSIESLLGIHKFTVNRQTNDSNCLWYATVFASKAREFQKLLGKPEEFVGLYNDCIAEGDHVAYGDAKTQQLDITSQYSVADFTKLSSDQLGDKKLHNFRDNIDFIIGNVAVIVSRQLQSFTVAPLSSNSFLVLNSNEHTVGIMSKASLKKYIIGDGYPIITCLVCSL